MDLHGPSAYKSNAVVLGKSQSQGFVVASTEVTFPAATLATDAAIRITYTGPVGSRLEVLPTPLASARSFEGCSATATRVAEGTGTSATVDICCPDVVGLTGSLWLALCPSEAGTPPVEFVVHQLEFVSNPDCIE
jgi:hypothetical protein